MPYYRSTGEIPRKRHARFRGSDGGRRAEELIGNEGFAADSALLYHRHPPTAITAAHGWHLPDDRLIANHPLLPRRFVTDRLPEAPGADVVTGRRLLLGNEDVRLWHIQADRASPLYRNAGGDELFYALSGSARLETVFGVLDVVPGDYVVLPACTTHRWVPDGAAGPLRGLLVEAAGHIGPPSRYLSARGQFLERAPYCERDLRGPEGPLLADDAAEDAGVDVLVRHRGGGTRYTYARHPFDVVGWDGCLYPYAFNIDDFGPVAGPRIQQPAPVHETFEGPDFVVCSFVPLEEDHHRDAVSVPYHHSNVDADEVMYHVGGDYEAPEGADTAIGSMSLHPSGLAHGPRPGAGKGEGEGSADVGAEAARDTAVRVDAFRPLGLGEAAVACEDPDYAWTWSGRHR